MRYNATSYRSKEHNDCTVRALAAASGVPYCQAYCAMKLAGRKPRRGIPFPSTVKNKGIPGFVFMCVYDRSKTIARDPTLKQFIREHRTGAYLVCMRGHAFAIRNGIVMDANKPGARTRIKYAWTVERVPVNLDCTQPQTGDIK